MFEEGSQDLQRRMWRRKEWPRADVFVGASIQSQDVADDEAFEIGVFDDADWGAGGS